MSTYDPFDPRHAALDEEDMIALGQDDPDDMTDITADAMQSADNAEPYIAPTDPPVLPGGRDNVEMAQGFATSSDGEEQRAGTPGDDEITQRVQHLLHTDAATTHLRLAVETTEGRVYLRGVVPGLDDTDLAAEVASRVPGVVDVVDEMTVAR